jgi:hypothetical protein
MFATRWDGAVDDPETLTPERIRHWIRDAAGDPTLAVEIETARPTTYGIALADRFREGDAFLIGDAAHRVTPRGGTGLNTAIRDGFDLAWKLAWVLRGWAGDDLLNSYERERRVVAEYNTGRSTRFDGSILPNNTGLSADIGGRLPHVWVEHEGAAASTLDLLGDGYTLFAGPQWDPSPAPRVSGGAPLTVRRLDPLAARGLGLTTSGSLLARPDGQVVALNNREPQESPGLERDLVAAG